MGLVWAASSAWWVQVGLRSTIVVPGSLSLLASHTRMFVTTTPQASSTSRKLQDIPDLGEYETAPPVVNYNNGARGTPNEEGFPTITNPTVLVGFEHDIVDASIVISHYFEGCQQLLPSNGLTSDLGETVMPPLPRVDLDSDGDVDDWVENSFTGLDGIYPWRLNGGGPGTLGAALTIIRYPVAVLETVDAITSTITLNNGSRDIEHKWCTRLDLIDGQGQSRGFREVDVSVNYNSNNIADATLQTQEDNQGQDATPAQLGDFTVNMFRADPASSTATELQNAPAVNQGESFKIGLIPQVTIDGGAPQDSVDMDIESVESCVFFLDDVANQQPDPSELQDVVISQGVANSDVQDLQCDGSVSATNGVDGCSFTVITLDDFFFPTTTETTEVRLRCIVNLAFQGRRHRRRVQVNNGDVFALASGTAIELGAPILETATDSCTDGCFILFCWVRFIICFFQDLFGF